MPSETKLDPQLTSSHLRKLLPCTKLEGKRFVKVVPLGYQRMIGHSIQCVRIVNKMTVLYSKEMRSKYPLQESMYQDGADPINTYSV